MSTLWHETLQTVGIFGYASKLWNGFDLLSKSLTGDPSLKMQQHTVKFNDFKENQPETDFDPQSHGIPMVSQFPIQV